MMEKLILGPLNVVTRQINSLFVNKEPWQVATMTATTVLVTVWMWEFVNQDESMAALNIHPIRKSNLQFRFVAQVFYREQRNAFFVSSAGYRQCRAKSTHKLAKLPIRWKMMSRNGPAG